MDTADQVSSAFVLRRVCLCVTCLIGQRVVNWWLKCVPFFSLCVRVQLASMGTFQVLKLPLGFIRVLEWVSCKSGFVCLFVFAWNNLSSETHTSVKNACSVKTLSVIVWWWANIRFGLPASPWSNLNFITSVTRSFHTTRDLIPAVTSSSDWKTHISVWLIAPWERLAKEARPGLSLVCVFFTRCANHMYFAPFHRNAPFSL